MKYKSELIKDIVDTRGHKKSSLHYESECIGAWIEEAKGAYPKLCDYESEWLNYIVQNHIGEFPYETVSTNTTATVNNVVPYAYKSAILNGNTKYRDIDTGEILESFEEGRNLELVSVKMPVLTTTGKNLCDNSKNKIAEINANTGQEITSKTHIISDYIKVESSNIICKAYQNGDIAPISTTYRVYNENKNYLGTNKNDIINGGYIRLRALSSDGAYNSENDILFQLEYGTQATSYEPFKSNILTVNEDVELRGIGDVKDELNCLTGELTQRIGEIVLDGSENWRQDTKNDTYTSFLLIGTNSKVTTFCVCDKLPQKNTPIYRLNSEGVVIGGSVGDLLVIIKKERLSTDSVIGFKEWLSQNNLTVQLQLDKPTVKTVDLSVTDQDGNTLSRIKPIEGTMHISTEGTPIKPAVSMEIPVEAITQNLASFIKEE